jgi:16S rRNA (uracil1498-N3)-methyltransferase
MLESSDDWNRRAARLQRIMIEAAEQSERTTIPELNGPTTLADFLATPGVVALVERSEGKPLLSVLPAALNSVSLAVGPEGGWSLRERDLIQRLSVPATLGSLILRAETAAIAAASAIFQDDLAHQERSS